MAGITTDKFFQTKRSTSEIKSEVFVKYFKFWCGVLLFAQQYKRIDEVLYIDLYSGPGYYDNNDPSTPIKILNSIYESKGKQIDLHKSVKIFFNDGKKKLIQTLENNIKELPYYNDLLHKPIYLSKPANKDLLDSLLKKGIPSLTFIDPFGYSYSLEMLLHSVKEWGSDLFMLFNINRIRAAIVNKGVEPLMNEIFRNQLSEIHEYYKKEKSPKRREEFILTKFEQLFLDKGYLLFKFKINFAKRNQTSHYLYLVTKVKLAYYKIKEIMKDYSDFQPDGVPVFSANAISPPIFFPEVEKFSILKLEEDLIANHRLYKGKSIERIYEEHSINTNYIKNNYKQAFENLFSKGAIGLLNSKGEKTTKITYTCSITF